MVRCGFCGRGIENPRKYRGEVVQRFCSKICRYKYHNVPRKNIQVNEFAEELFVLLRKYGFLR